MMNHDYDINEKQVRRTIELLFEPEQVFECRCLDASKGASTYTQTRSGYFTNVDALLKELNGIKAKGIYVVLNAFSHDRLALANNKLRHTKDQSTARDADITTRRWLLIDCDPERTPKEIASSEEEHEAGLSLARSIRNTLTDLGWPEPIYADSGNGGHLLYRINLPADDGGLVQRVLQAIAQGFDTEAVKVDQNVFNAARISKLYGTWARKGDDSPELGRPHRRSQILEAPDVVEVIGKELLEALAGTVEQPEPEAKARTQSSGQKPFDMEGFLNKHSIERTGPHVKQNGKQTIQMWFLKECPLCKANGAGNTSVAIFLIDDIPGFECKHSQCGDMHWSDFRRHYEPDYKEKKRVSPHWQDGQKHSDIVINEQKNVNLAQVMESLHWLNEQDEPCIFAHGTAVVRFGLGPDMLEPDIMRPGLFPLEQHALTNLMSEAANYYRETKEGYADIYPPPVLANAVLALTPQERGFPPVKAVIEAPTFRRDGSLIIEEGYDAASGYYYHPRRDMQNIVLQEKPTKDEVIAARNVLWNVFGEFPYVSDADRANNFAFGLTPFIRPFINSLAPMCYTEASIAGSGKGLNTDAWALITSGQVASKCSAVDNTELEKRILALLSVGRTLICIDNVRGKLESKALENALTAELYEGRTLGKSEARQVPNLATWCCNGNNATLAGDLPRRCYRVRFTPDSAQPWLKDFRIKNLRGYIRQHRAELVQACLTIISGWLVAGRPAGDKSVIPLGSYETWTTTMNGILTYAGIDGFLRNMQEFYLENNDEATQMTAFFEECMTEYAGRSVTVDKITSDIKVKGSLLSDALPPDLAALVADPNTTDKMIAKDLSYKLRKYKDRPFGERGYRVVRADTQGHTHRAEWKFVETVTRNLTSWDIKSAYHAHDAHDVFNAINPESHSSNGDMPVNDGENVILDSNSLKHSAHSTHGTQNSNEQMSDSKRMSMLQDAGDMSTW